MRFGSPGANTTNQAGLYIKTLMPGQFSGVRADFGQVRFLRSAATLEQLPAGGAEVAFAGRSNAGKSSAINVVAGARLARVSKMPGRTQLINLFTLGTESLRLVDLPGYGYARVPEGVRAAWGATVTRYLEQRGELKGLVLLVDIRRGLGETDWALMDLWGQRPLHIVLTKSDQLGRAAARDARDTVVAARGNDPLISVQTFSALSGEGTHALHDQLLRWLSP